MKMSISNISWEKKHDDEMYKFLMNSSFEGIEIAPTRVFENDPYIKVQEASLFANKLKCDYGLAISSIQSIWYKKTENLFGSKKEREFLKDYTKRAIDFAAITSCKNIVFGNPRNRITYMDSDYELAVDFFREIGEYAYEKGTTISIEPNPTIYNTNFITQTSEAYKLVDIVNSEGFKVNVDLGTIIENEETLDSLKSNIRSINHIHISEPKLAIIKKRELHKELFEQLKLAKYKKYISIEMSMQSLDNVKKTIKYIEELVI